MCVPVWVLCTSLILATIGESTSSTPERNVTTKVTQSTANHTTQSSTQRQHTTKECIEPNLFYIIVAGIGALTLCNCLCVLCYTRKICCPKEEKDMTSVPDPILDDMKKRQSPQNLPGPAIDATADQTKEAQKEGGGEDNSEEVKKELSKTSAQPSSAEETVELPKLYGDGPDPIEQQREAQKKDRSIYGVPSFKSLNIAAPTQSARHRQDAKLKEWELEGKKYPRTKPKKGESDSLYGIPDLPRQSVFYHES